MFELLRRYRFESAHHLPNAGPEHRCARVHGHSYEVEVRVRGQLGAVTGWVIDYADIDSACRPALAELDHRLLNDVEGLANPTSEHVARWLWERLHDALPGLHSITVAENPDAICRYWGPRDLSDR
jgi:6-pyruvoyltetrahydropterin/6-carboxytetrahydropterin synthase